MIKIAIDAGHGLYTAGKRITLKGYESTREWSLNDAIADELQYLLSFYNCEVQRMDDTTGATDVSLKNRVKKANNWGADVYISIHHNAGVHGGSGGGTVVFYYSSKSERAVQAIDLYNQVVNLTGLIGNRSTKVKKKGYYVIKNTKMPAFLIENGFMDSKTDVPIILTEAHAHKTARGLLNFLIKNYGLNSRAEDPIISKEVGFRVKIKVDDLNYRSGPGTTYAVGGQVKKGYVFTIAETSGNWGKLKSGAGWINISSKYVTRL